MKLVITTPSPEGQHGYSIAFRMEIEKGDKFHVKPGNPSTLEIISEGKKTCYSINVKEIGYGYVPETLFIHCSICEPSTIKMQPCLI